MKILVTGSSGFVGTHLVRSLTKHKVVRYDIKNGNDIFDKKLLAKKIKDVDIVIHLAAFISAPESWNKEEEYYKNNSLGTLRVLEASIKYGVKKFIFFSSAAVKTEPKTPYAISKLFAEEILKLHKEEIEIVILRPENIYGEGQKEAYGYVIHNFIKNILHNKRIEIYGTGEQSRDFINVVDIVKVVEKLIKLRTKSGDIISIGTGKDISIKDLAVLVMKLVGRNVEITHLPQRKEPKHSKADLKALNKLEIDTGKFLSLEKGIKKLINTYK